MESFIRRAMLVKTAASIEQLRKAYKRIGVIRLPKLKKRDLKKLKSKIMAGDVAHFGPAEKIFISGGAGNVTSKSMTKRLVPQISAGKLRSTRRAGLPPAAEAGFKRALKQQADDTIRSAGKRSFIGVSKGGVTAKMMAPKASGETKKGIAIVSGLHEGFERSAMKRPRNELSYGFGHASPDVLAKEHNLLARLTGPGSKETREVYQNVRGKVGDSKALNNLLVDRFGPRASIQYGEGKKIPKAMRKALRRKHSKEIWNVV